MKMQTFVMIRNVAKHGFRKKQDLKNGTKVKEKIIGPKL